MLVSCAKDSCPGSEAEAWSGALLFKDGRIFLCVDGGLRKLRSAF